MISLLVNADCIAFRVVVMEISDVVSLWSVYVMLDRNMMVMNVVNMLVAWSLVNSGWSGDISEWSVDNFVDWLWSYDEWNMMIMVDIMVGIMMEIVVDKWMMDIVVDKWMMDIMMDKWMVVMMIMMAMMLDDDWGYFVSNSLNWVISHIWVFSKGESLS